MFYIRILLNSYDLTSTVMSSFILIMQTSSMFFSISESLPFCFFFLNLLYDVIYSSRWWSWLWYFPNTVSCMQWSIFRFSFWCINMWRLQGEYRFLSSTIIITISIIMTVIWNSLSTIFFNFLNHGMPTQWSKGYKSLRSSIYSSE